MHSKSSIPYRFQQDHYRLLAPHHKQYDFFFQKQIAWRRWSLNSPQSYTEADAPSYTTQVQPSCVYYLFQTSTVMKETLWETSQLNPALFIIFHKTVYLAFLCCFNSFNCPHRLTRLFTTFSSSASFLFPSQPWLFQLGPPFPPTNPHSTLIGSTFRYPIPTIIFHHCSFTRSENSWITSHGMYFHTDLFKSVFRIFVLTKSARILPHQSS